MQLNKFHKTLVASFVSALAVSTVAIAGPENVANKAHDIVVDILKSQPKEIVVPRV